MNSTKSNLREASDEEFMTDVAGIMTHLRSVGAPHRGGSEQDNLRLMDLALEIALEAQNRLKAQRRRICQLEEIAVTDEMTGLLNRRGFERRLRQEMSQAQRHEEEGLLIYIDLNNFKPINDTFGHLAGDEVLRQAASIIQRSVRETDVIGRLGGDEFAVLMPRTTHYNGMTRARQLKRDLNNAYASWEGEMIAFGASVGTYAYKGEENWETVLNHADASMYQDKTTKGSATLPQRALAR